MTAREGETLDSIAGGRIRLLQREAGYRFNLDAVLLAHFGLEHREPHRATRVVDLGTGCGVVALLIAAARPAWQVTAIEVQRSLAELARRNAVLNGLHVEVIESDWRVAGEPGSADLVVCNPPYFAPDRGQPCADAEKSAARQEVHGTIEETVRAARRLVHPRGLVRFVYGASRLPELVVALERADLPLVRMRLVHPKAREAAYAVLAEAIPGSSRPLVVEPPLVVHGADGGFTPAVAAMLAA